VTRIRAARPGDVDHCIGVLASLPDHFTPDTHESARRGPAAIYIAAIAPTRL
jgi:hypothetical protein